MASSATNLLTGFLLLLLPWTSSSSSSAPAPSPETKQTDVEALLEFRRSVRDPLGALSGWDPGAAAGVPCSWRGITCSGNGTGAGRVTELRLPRLGLSGEIPASTLLGLPYLTKLTLRSNSFHGPFPATDIAALPRLAALSLQGNSLSGPLIFFSNLSGIQILNLAGNRFSGELPTSLPPNLRYLDISSNTLSGQIPPSLPPSAPRLEYLDLSSNRLSGGIPAAIAELRYLLYLLLDSNSFEGPLPAAIAGIPTLQVLSLSGNRLSGDVPSSVFFNSSGTELQILKLGSNSFTGMDAPPVAGESLNTSAALRVLDLRENSIVAKFPAWIAGVTSMTTLDLSGNSFSGVVPPEIGRLLVLQELRLWRNSMSGGIPEEIGSCGALRVLDLGDNGFSGEVPAILGNLSALRELSLGRNSLSGGIPEELTLLNNLTTLDLSGNGISGEIPSGIGSLGSLRVLNLSDNQISGEIPPGIGSLLSLTVLDLSGQKNLSGTLPPELFGLSSLQIVSLAGNSISGELPEGFSGLTALKQLNLSGNSLNGSIPASYGYLASLQTFSLSGNGISGEIPPELGNCSNLTVLQLRSNALSGPIPAELSHLFDLEELNVGRNNLSGEIPPAISQCASLATLRLDGNELSGDIPGSISNLSKLQTLDLSSNNLTGPIPPDVALIAGMTSFNVSGNRLEGDIPAMLAARFADPALFAGNRDLCGPPLATECDGESRRKRKREHLILWTGLAAGGVCVLATSCCCLAVVLFCWRQRFSGDSAGKSRSPARGSGMSSAGKRSSGGTTESGTAAAGAPAPKLVMFSNRVTYSETVEATRRFDEESVLSRGRHGLVFKACYSDGAVLSILRLPSTSADGSTVVDESLFRKEAESLGKVKHRNLTVLRGYYAGPPPDVRLLVYDYMPNGDLAALLREAQHGGGGILNWPMRHLVALGIAKGLAHLHAAGVVHGDVRPENVLFDADFEPHLSGFGLERVSAMATAVSATREDDVYRFGVVMLELLTGRRRSPAIGAGEVDEDDDIVRWVKGRLQGGMVEELVEVVELGTETNEWEEFLLGIKVGLLCTASDRLDRPAMADVVFMIEGCRVGPEEDPPSSTDPTSLPSPVAGAAAH